MNVDALLISCDEGEEEEEDELERNMEEDADEDNFFYDETADQADEDFVISKQKSQTDAILQCPCCFQTVCRDCQQHTRYKNMFRAMFVMGVAVLWDRPLRYDSKTNSLQEVPAPTNPERNRIEDDTVYYTVCCANCETVVAALDMTDEVYHFSHCLASAAPSPAIKEQQDAMVSGV